MTEMVVGPVGALLSLDLWHGTDDAAAALAAGFALPAAGRAETLPTGSVLRVGPRRWWLLGAGFSGDAIAQALGDSGTVTTIAGGWVRVQLVGSTWRDLLMDCGLIDAESPDFGPGTVAVTLLSHARCVVHVRDAMRCDLFVPASYAEHCLAQWRDLGWQQVAA